MSSKNYNLKSLLLTLLVIATIVGCSDSSSDDLMTSNQEVAGEKSIAPSLKSGDSDSSESEGGTLKRLWGDPPTLDPHLVTDTTLPQV